LGINENNQKFDSFDSGKTVDILKTTEFYILKKLISGYLKHISIKNYSKIAKIVRLDF
jgi:hypothetical protein